jgi:DNA invertase Pin-like site-specific DNA recombinase
LQHNVFGLRVACESGHKPAETCPVLQRAVVDGFIGARWPRRSIINTFHELTERGVTVRSLHDGVDTSTSTGRMVAGILMSIAEYERELVRERTALKLEHARKSGRKFGRPAKLNADQAALARRMKANGETAATICETLGIGRTTLYRYLAEDGAA